MGALFGDSLRAYRRHFGTFLRCSARGGRPGRLVVVAGSGSEQLTAAYDASPARRRDRRPDRGDLPGRRAADHRHLHLRAARDRRRRRAPRPWRAISGGLDVFAPLFFAVLLAAVGIALGAAPDRARASTCSSAGTSCRSRWCSRAPAAPGRCARAAAWWTGSGGARFGDRAPGQPGGDRADRVLIGALQRDRRARRDQRGLALVGPDSGGTLTTPVRGAGIDAPLLRPAGAAQAVAGPALGLAPVVLLAPARAARAAPCAAAVRGRRPPRRSRRRCA